MNLNLSRSACRLEGKLQCSGGNRTGKKYRAKTSKHKDLEQMATEAKDTMKDKKAGMDSTDLLIRNMVSLHDRMNKRLAEFLKVRGYLGKDEMRSHETEITGLHKELSALVRHLASLADRRNEFHLFMDK